MIGFVKGLKASMFVPPVGYIWKSASAVSPASIYEGTTWAQIKDRAILAAGTSYENGTTGGSASEQLAVSNLPSHAHACSISSGSSHTHSRYIAEIASAYGERGEMSRSDNFAIDNSTITTSSGGNHSHTVEVGSAGSGQAFSVLNPYIVRYAWERIS